MPHSDLYTWMQKHHTADPELQSLMHLQMLKTIQDRFRTLPEEIIHVVLCIPGHVLRMKKSPGAWEMDFIAAAGYTNVCIASGTEGEIQLVVRKVNACGIGFVLDVSLFEGGTTGESMSHSVRQKLSLTPDSGSACQEEVNDELMFGPEVVPLFMDALAVHFNYTPAEAACPSDVHKFLAYNKFEVMAATALRFMLQTTDQFGVGSLDIHSCL